MKKSVFAFLLFFSTFILFAQENNHRYNHILITNDDGIENIDILVALAKSVKPLANRVSIIVSSQNRSASSNYLAFGEHQSSYEIKTEYYDSKNNVGVYTIPDYPADCVLLGLSGLFPNDRPDLVLSGINSGSNVGPSWFGSGTIGAVRTAAFLGVPAIAFSGFDDDNKESFTLIPQWIAQFLDSGIVERMNLKTYLTVAFPEIPLDEIKGVKTAKRRITYGEPKAIQFKKIFGDSLNISDNKTIWAFSPTGNPNTGTVDDDVSFLEKGFVVISAMTVDENDENLLKKLQSMKTLVPEFEQ